jgi:hypothetical protein
MDLVCGALGGVAVPKGALELAAGALVAVVVRGCGFGGGKSACHPYNTMNDRTTARRTFFSMTSASLDPIRHRIESVAAKGMASRQPPQGQPAPSKRAEPRDGFCGVVGARGEVPA